MVVYKIVLFAKNLVIRSRIPMLTIQVLDLFHVDYVGAKNTCCL